MSYPNVNDPDFTKDLLTRKEFANLITTGDNFRDRDNGDGLNNYFRVKSHQLFAGNFMNPNTPYKRLHLSWVTGTGKTRGALCIANKFIQVYKKLFTSMMAAATNKREQLDVHIETPTVFVIGFRGSKDAFVRDLLKYPEYGFVSSTEREELLAYQKAAKSGLPEDLKNFNEYFSRLKRRITNKSKGGFFKFFGYEEFASRLFSGEVSLVELEAIATIKLRSGEDVTLEQIFADYIQQGKLRVNTNMLKMFKNSLLICDEIHQTYNMSMKNNRGVAIQYILDTVPDIRFISLSATPINNSATEIVELVNYLVPGDQKITKRDYFTNGKITDENIKKIGKLLRGRISFLQDTNIKYYPQRIIAGDIITLPHDVGDAREGSRVPYLQFIQCPMSELHERTIANMGMEPAEAAPIAAPPASSTATTGALASLTPFLELEDSNNDHSQPATIDADEAEVRNIDPSRKYIPTDGYTLFDMVFPSPDSETMGLYRSSQITTKLYGASQQWKDAHGINIKKFSATNNIIVGRFLAKENIGKYSTKYHTLLTLIANIMAGGGGAIGANKARGQTPIIDSRGKIMIYHDRVKMSGVLLIQELLRENHFIDEHNEPLDTTICAICSRPRSDRQAHPDRPARGSRRSNSMSLDSASQSLPSMNELESPNGPAGPAGNLQQYDQAHEYTPARFMVVHGDMEAHLISGKLSKFNAPSNAMGHEYLILVGSKIIKESWEIKDVQNMIITSSPVNIPTLIQVFGRCVRRDSHVNLPPEKRRVQINILLSTVSPGAPGLDPISPELYRYIDKLAEYITIQRIEREINRNAVDAIVNRDINMSQELMAQYFPADGTEGPKGSFLPDSGRPPTDIIGNLYFTPADDIGNLEDIKNRPNLLTFLAYQHSLTEISTISYIIKRAFVNNPAFDYESLLKYVRNPPFGVETNPAMIGEENFIIALHGLTSDSIPITSSRRNVVTNMIESLLDVDTKIIYRNGVACKIVPLDKYYVAFPLNNMTLNIINTSTDVSAEKYRDKDIAFMRDNKPPIVRPHIDVETYMRGNTKTNTMRVNISKYLKSKNKADNFTEHMKEVADMLAGQVTHIEAAKFTLDLGVSFQIAAITHAVAAIADSVTLASPAAPRSNIEGDPSKATPKNDQPENDLAVCGKIVELFNLLGVVIYAKEVKKYKDVIKQFSLENLPADETPMGFVGRKSVKIYDVAGSKWITISKETMNKRVTFKENPIIIGIADATTEVVKFKLRSPYEMGAAAVDTADDSRLIERGMVCTTKPKYELEEILQELNVTTEDKQRIKSLCSAITNELYRREVAERGKNSRVKYVYGWWDDAK